MHSSHLNVQKTHMLTWLREAPVWKAFEINQTINSPRLPSCSRCVHDVIPGRSHGGLSPIRLHQATPQADPSACLLWNNNNVNHQWTVDSICGPSSALSGNNVSGGTQMEVHLKAKRNSFAMKRIDFPLISDCSQDTLLVFASYPRTEKIIHLLAGFMPEFMRSSIWWVFRVWGPAVLYGQRQRTIWVKVEKKHAYASLTKG